MIDLPGTLHDSATRVLLAIIRLREAGKSPTVRAIGAETGLRSTSTVHYQLRTLRLHGLIGWEPGRAGTVVPLVRPVAWG